MRQEHRIRCLSRLAMSQGGAISTFFGTRWAVVAVAASLGAGLLAIPVVSGGTGTPTPTPTPTATATPTYTCVYTTGTDSCFPKPPGNGASSVGIPAGETLTSCGGGGDVTISTSQTITNCSYSGSITISGSATVTIRKSRIPGRISQAGAVHSATFTIEDSDIGPSSGCTSSLTYGVGVHHYTARRNYIHNLDDGFRSSDDGSVTIEDNYVATCSNPLDHSDGFQGYGSGPNVVVNHNTIDQRGATDITAPLFAADNSAPLTATNNLLIARDASAAAIKLHDDASPDQSGWVVTGNRVIGGAANIGSDCSSPKWTWSGNKKVTVDSSYNLLTIGLTLNCDGSTSP